MEEGTNSAQSTSADSTLDGYRTSIDNIDSALIHILAERFKITEKIGAHKARTGLPAEDPQREQRQVARLRALAATAGLDPAFTEKFLRFVIDEVIRHHSRHKTTATGDQSASAVEAGGVGSGSGDDGAAAESSAGGDGVGSGSGESGATVESRRDEGGDGVAGG